MDDVAIINRSVAIALITLLLSGCYELCYDPSRSGIAPSTPGSVWAGKPLKIPHTEASSVSLSDLSATMPLLTLIDIALENNPATQASWYGARAAAYGLRASTAAYYPTIDLVGSISSVNTTVGGRGGGGNITTTAGGTAIAGGNAAGTITNGTNSPTPGRNGSGVCQDNLFSKIVINYLLLDFGGRDAQVELARQMLYAADWQHNRTVQQVLITVITAYTAFLGNEALAAASEQNLQDALVALEAAQKMQRAGLATNTDVLQAQATVAQRQLTVAQSSGAVKTALGQLVIAIGLPPETQLSVETLPHKLPVVDVFADISSLYEVAKKHRPDLGIAEAIVKQQQEQKIISYSQGMPILVAKSVLSRTHFYPTPNLDGHDNSATLEVDFPLFAGFFYLNQQRQLSEQVNQAVANLNLQLSQVALDVVINYYAFTTAVAVLPSSEAYLQYSDSAYRSILSKYKAGTASILDVLNALTVLSDARAQSALSRTQWATALANLAYATGTLADTSVHWSSE